MRASDRDLIRGGNYGQRSCEPHFRVGFVDSGNPHLCQILEDAATQRVLHELSHVRERVRRDDRAPSLNEVAILFIAIGLDQTKIERLHVSNSCRAPHRHSPQQRRAFRICAAGATRAILTKKLILSRKDRKGQWRLPVVMAVLISFALLQAAAPEF
jgi:hypothetical protein